jgi:hypothetical protein
MFFFVFFQREMKYYMLVMVLWGLVGGITYRERREAGQGLRNRRSTSDDVIQVPIQTHVHETRSFDMASAH